MKMPNFEAWAIFGRAAELGSFSRAAKELGIAKPTVSKSIARLEAQLGVTLFARTSRKVTLTETGKNALVRVKRILSEGAMLEAETQDSTIRPHGLVKLAAPMTFGIRHLAPIMPQFLDKYPDIDVMVDYSDAFVDIIGGGFDAAIRITSLADSTLRSRRFCEVRLLLVATPMFLDRIGRPRHPRDLENLPAFVYMNSRTSGFLRMKHRNGEECTVTKRGRYHANNAEAFLPALFANQGIGLFPEFMIWDDVSSGRLEHILPEWSTQPIGVHVVTPPGQLRPARVSVLLDFLAARYAQAPWAAPSIKEATAEAAKRRSGEAAKRRSGEAAKRRSGEAAKRRSGEAAKRRRK